MIEFDMEDPGEEQEPSINVNEMFDAIRSDDPPEAETLIGEDIEPKEFRLCEVVPGEAGMGYFSLRPYQNEAVESVFEDFQHYQSTMVVLPTGCGKTVAFAEIAMRWPESLGRVLVIAHREELIDQAAEKIGLHLDEMTGIEMGDRREYRGGIYGKVAKVLVASVQTLSREKRREKFNPKDFGLLIVDECHHFSAASYRKVMMYFLANPQLRLLGVTATPKRADGKALGDVSQSVAYEMTLPHAIEEGWLVDIEQKVVVVEGLDFSKCRTTAGDLNERDLVNQMMGGTAEKIEANGQLTDLQIEQIQQQEKMLHAVVSPTIAESQGRPTLVFCVTKAHAERMTEVFKRHPGITAEFVTDDTTKEDRKQIIGKFKAGQIQVLVGVGVFTEGFDSRVDVVVIARPTKSEGLYRQMVGRGTRPLPGLVDKYNTAAERREAIGNSVKPTVTVLDFVGATSQHNLCNVTDILGGEYEQDVIEAAKNQLRNGSTEVVGELLQKTKAELDAKKRQMALDKLERDRAAAARAEEEKNQRAAEAANRERIRAEAKYTATVVPLKGAVIPEQVGVGVFRGGSTDSQVKLLIRLGIREEAACRFTRGQAGQVIDKLSNQTGGDYVMRFGKYMGIKLKDLPSGYRDWAVKNMTDASVQSNLRLMATPSGNQPQTSDDVPF